MTEDDRGHRRTSPRARPAATLLAWALALAPGCYGATDICPEGQRPSLENGNCVALDSGTRTEASTTGSPENSTGPARTPLPGLDSGMDAEAGDADAGEGVDGEAGVRDTGVPDAEAGDADAGLRDADAGDPDAGDAEAGLGDAEAGDPDAGDDGGDPARTCTDDDALAWSMFQTQGGLIESIDVCASDPACAVGLCPLVECVHDSAGVAGCDDCVEEQVRCVFNACFDECSNDSTDAACVECACEAGCTALFEDCSGRALGICDACHPAIFLCHGMHPWPALIVPILHPLL